MIKFLWTFLFLISLSFYAEAYDFNNPNVSGDTVAHLDDIFASAYDGDYLCAGINQTVKFPNYTGLEGCVRKFIKNNRWPLSCSQALEIRRLECDDPSITSLEGLQQFPNLEILTFSGKGTKIDNLSPIRNLTNLHTLAIPKSNISDFAFLSALSNLKNLDLSRNHVTDLQYLAYLTKLESLSLEYEGPNYITDVTPIRLLPFLRNLSLQGNKITDIAPLGEAGSLEYLNIRDNRIASLAPLSNLRNLGGINASINMIDDLNPLTNLQNLTSVTVNSNRLNNIDALRGLANLTYISFIGNNITDISPVADKRRIRSVSLDYNAIKDLSSIHSIMVYADLSELGLAYNCVPKEDYEKIKYLKDIGKVRLQHQCEIFDPKDAVPDISTVVNGDLVGAEDLGIGGKPGGTGDENDNNSQNPGVSESAGRGCSAAPVESKGGYIDIIYAFFIVSFFIKYFLWDKRGKSI